MNETGVVLKCKNCGAGLDLSQGGRTIRCKYCETYTLLPENPVASWIDTLNRGNAYRNANEFQRAVDLYEDFLKNNPGDAEAHWQCALARFGIEYVKEAGTGEFKPTCHRISYDSFYEDIDYKAAIKYSDGAARESYEREAKKIVSLLEQLIRVSRNEKPYDVFISFKAENDETGERTIDSVKAQDLYEMLTQQGYRVFFSRITLEGKLGTEFEPLIYAALNSAKVMLVVGSSRKNFEAVWVQNEWQRYNALVKKDRAGRTLIPCYFDMNVSELPEELRMVQGVDLNKIGVHQDILTTIRKVAGDKRQRETYYNKQEQYGYVQPNQYGYVQPKQFVAPPTPKVTNEDILNIAEKLLKHGKYGNAKTNCDAVLKSEPKNERALFVALLASCGLNDEKLLKKKYNKRVESSSYHAKLMECASEELKNKLLRYKKQSEKHRVATRITGIIFACLGLVAAIICSVFIVKQVKYFNGLQLNHIITERGELTKTIVDKYKQEAQEKMNAYISSKNVYDSDYSDKINNLQYVGYCFNVNKENNTLFYIYRYDAYWEMQNSIVSGDTVFGDSQQFFSYVAFEDVGIQNNGDSCYQSDSLTGHIVDIDGESELIYGEYDFAYNGFLSYEELMNEIESKAGDADFHVDEGKTKPTYNRVNLLYQQPTASNNASILDLSVTYGDGETYKEVIYFNGTDGSGRLWIEYEIPEGYNRLTFTYTGYPGWFGSGDEMTVQVYDVDTGEYFFNGENVKYEQSVTADVDITNRKRIGILFNDVKGYAISAVAKDIYISHVDVEEAETDEE